MQPFKDRNLGIGRKVRVYWNFHRGMFSVMDSKTRQVVAHTDAFVLTNARFVVNQKGRERVRRERRKNVHAWVEGFYQGYDLIGVTLKGNARYSPYNDVHKGFYNDSTYEAVEGPYETVSGYGSSVFYGEKL